MPTSHEAVFLLAIEAAVVGDPITVEEIFTEDVVAWSPILSAGSRDELALAYAERDNSLSNIEFAVDALDVIGDKVIAEWRLAADHTGPIVFDEDVVVEATGRRIILAGASFAEFRGEQISAMRTYFDDAALIEQLLIED